jgi:hypothetical protein
MAMMTPASHEFVDQRLREAAEGVEKAQRETAAKKGYTDHSNHYYRPTIPKESYRCIKVELPTPSATDVRCRALQRQNKCGTKWITETAAEMPRSCFARACVNDI